MKRRIWFWGILVSFAATVLGWMLWVPYDSVALYRAVPVQATFVTAHARLADRWSSMIGNPLVQSLGQTMGVDGEDLQALRSNPDAEALMDLLASRETLLAYVPKSEVRHEEAWVVASWIGGRSQRLRWILSFRSISGLEAVGRQRGRTIWAIHDAHFSDGARLHAVLVEGMVIACLSRDSTALFEVLDVYDGFSPSLHDLPRTLQARMDLRDDQAPDRGWVRRGAAWEKSPLRWGLTSLSSRRVTGRMQMQQADLHPVGPAEPKEPRPYPVLLGNRPEAVLLAQPGLLAQYAPQLPGPVWPLIARAGLAEASPEPAVLALMGGIYSGRFKGLKLPSLVFAVALKEPGRADELVQELIDRINAAYRWGLIAARGDDRRMVYIESTADTGYASLEPDERLAYIVDGPWLLISSNAGALGRLLEYAPSGEVPAWQKPPPGAAPRALFWSDLGAAGKTLRSAVAVYSLKLLLEDPEETQGVRELLLLTQAWVDALEPFGAAGAEVQTVGEDLELIFQLGQPTLEASPTSP